MIQGLHPVYFVLFLYQGPGSSRRQPVNPFLKAGFLTPESSYSLHLPTSLAREAVAYSQVSSPDTAAGPCRLSDCTGFPFKPLVGTCQDYVCIRYLL